MKTRFFFTFLSIIFLFIAETATAQVSERWLWKRIDTAFYYAEVDAPRKSDIADSKITVIKIDPRYYDAELIIATERDSLFRTLPQWNALEKLNFSFNAGMYTVSDRLHARGFMRNGNHYNNKSFKDGFGALLAFSPTEKSLPPFKIIDLSQENYADFADKYRCFVQSIRMISADGEPVYWKKHLSCSMIFVATDKADNLLVFFTRTPYTPNEMTDFMLQSPLEIQTAMYLEGGPEASFFISNGDFSFGKFGSYVSKTHPTDKNNEFKKMPNVIGLKKISNL